MAEPGLLLHQYADDCQICNFCESAAAPYLTLAISPCVSSLATLMCPNQLQLNTSNTEVI